VTLKLKFRQR